MKKLEWFERQFVFNIYPGMMPFFFERLEGTLVRLEKKIENQPDSLLSQKLDGKWSVKQNIGHLGEVDNVAFKRIDEMLNGITLMSPAVFEPLQDYNTLSIQEVFHFFKLKRLENLRRYRTLTEVERLQSSVHPRLKVRMTPVDLAFFDAEHDDHHLVRINEILMTLTS